MSKYEKGKIVRDDGKSSLEEYTIDSRSSQRQAQENARPSVAQDAANTFGSNPLPQPVPTVSIGPNLIDGPLSNYADLYESTLNIEEFKFLECDPLNPMENADPCPICRPNPYAYVPDYRMAADGDVFFDGKNCTQNIVLTFPSPVSANGLTTTELKKPKFQREQKERGIKLMLDYFNKADTATAYYYERTPPRDLPGRRVRGGIIGALPGLGIGLLALAPGVGPVAAIAAGSVIGAAGAAVGTIGVSDKPGYDLKTREIDCIEELMQYAEFDYSIPIQFAASTRVLISIPVEQLYRVPNKMISEPNKEFFTNLEVTFDGREMVPMARRLKNAFRVYNNQLKRWRDFEGGSLIEVSSAGSRKSTLDLERESDKIGSFIDDLGEMLDELGFSLGAFKPAKTPEKIVIKFVENDGIINIQQIQVNLPGCPFVRLDAEGEYKGIFNTYAKRATFNGTGTRSRTMHYIGVLPEIDYAITARAPTPWLEVVTNYTYPAVEVRYGENDNTIFNNPTALSCLISRFPEGSDSIPGSSVTEALGADEFFEQTQDMVFGLGEAALQRYAKLSCYSTEDKLKELKDFKKYGGELSSQSKRVVAALKEKIAVDDPYLEIILEEIFASQKPAKISKSKKKELRAKGQLKSDKKKRRQEANPRGLFFERLNDRLGYCGWIALTVSAIDCISQGIAGEDASKLLAKAAFDAMEDAAVSRTFLGLSSEQQLKIVESIKTEFGSLPAPWETAEFGGTYEPGSYTGGGLSSGELFKGKPEYRGLTNEQKKAARKEKRIEDRQALPERTEGFFGTTYEDGEFQFNQGRAPQGSGGSYGSALGSVQKAASDALRNAMLDSLGADELLDAMNRLPGAPIVSQILRRTPCRQTPLISSEPRLDSFLSTLAFDFCQWDGDITWPKFDSNLPAIYDIFLLLAEAVKDAIIDTAIAILMNLLKLIVEKIFTIACDSLATLGANLLDLFNTNNHFRDLLRDNLCPDATTEEIDRALKELFGAIGGPEASCLETMSSAEMGQFIDDLSVMLTQGQIVQLLQGNASEETIKLAIEVARLSPSECIRKTFTDPDNMSGFFRGLEPFIPSLDDLVPERSFDEPPNPCDEDTRNRIDDLKCELLAEKGLTPEECREQLDDLKDKALQDLKDLADSLQNGPFSGMPPIISDDDCPESGFFPKEHPLQKSLNQNISKSMMEKIEETTSS